MAIVVCPMSVAYVDLAITEVPSKYAISATNVQVVTTQGVH